VGLNECTQHGIFASKRCAVCLKPLCIQCTIKDGCCSERCFKSRQKFLFANTGPVQRPGGIPWGTLIKLAALAGAAYAAARYFEYL